MPPSLPPDPTRTAGAANRIRPARIDEAVALSALALRSKALWGYDDAFLAACRPLLRVGVEEIAAGDVFVAELGSLVQGFYGLGIEPDENRAPAPEIASFFVEPDAVGQGIGRALWVHLAAEVRRRAWPVLRIAADPDAVGFYERMGATRIGETPAGVGGRALPLLLWSPSPR